MPTYDYRCRACGATFEVSRQEHLSKEIQRLDGRPIHSSEHGVDDYQDADERQAEADERARRKQEIAPDLAHGGAVDEASRREAEVALGLEETGAIPGPVDQAQSPREDFRDGNNQPWDVKAFRSPGPDTHQPYTRSHAERKIQAKLDAGAHVALDSSNLNQQDFEDLKDLVASRPDWKDKVVIY